MDLKADPKTYDPTKKYKLRKCKWLLSRGRCPLGLKFGSSGNCEKPQDTDILNNLTYKLGNTESLMDLAMDTESCSECTDNVSGFISLE